MNHEQAKDLIAALVLDGLDPTDEAELGRHLTECRDCTAELEAYQKMWHDVAEAGSPRPSTEDRYRLGQTIRQFQDGQNEVSLGRRPWLWQIAAALALVVGGALAGSTYERTRAAAPDETTGPRFLMLMRGVDVAEAADSTVSPDFRDWVGRLRDEQRLVGGEAMGDSTGVWAGSPPASLAMDGPYQLDGFMMIQASTMREAWQIAQGAPHLRQGGAVEIWPLR